ncbi:cellulose synthase [Nocardioides dongkuii]|uniref:cellulose synthase n=1 Tax=Nocardioides dongkuii TaxID=2760089 RepID=UPI0015FA1714|nr:cellulose synthase [Nocardioides dongkuii]
MDDASWAALTLSLTVLGGIWTWFAFRRRGLASGVRGLGLTLLPLAAYLTKTLRMFTRIVDAVTDWALALAFSPTVWAGVLLAGASVALLVGARALESRSPRSGARPPKRLDRSGKPATGTAPAIADDDLADIEELLRRRGIS